MSDTPERWILPAYRHRNRTYAALTHWEASDLLPSGAVQEAKSGFVNDKGQFLNRLRAYDYADKNDLLRIRGTPGQRNELWSEAKLHIPRAALDYLEWQDARQRGNPLMGIRPRNMLMGAQPGPVQPMAAGAVPAGVKKRGA